jgi:phosphatidylglycerol:prolipoprotein diacylglycerol transferase
MYPILGRYGPFFLYSYTVVLGLGLAAGIGLTAWLVTTEKNDKLNFSLYPGWLDGLLLSLLAGFIGGRVGFVWANWFYFLDAPDEIALVWQGGLSYHGGLVSALLAFWLWSIWQRRNGRTRDSENRVSFTVYAALLMPGLALAHLFGWLACWLEGCAYGRETALGLFTADLPDSFGVYAVRYQTQVFGIVLCAAVFALALFFRSRLRARRFFWLIFGLLSGSQAVIALFRGDPAPLIGAIRLDTLVSIGLIVISLVGLGLRFKED